MHLCYVDELGTPELPGTSSHFVLAGLALPISEWKKADASLSAILQKYALAGQEVHTAWIVRKYVEQSKISGFEELDWPSRRSAVARFRAQHLLDLQKKQQSAAYKQAKKNYRHTEAYAHLTHAERLLLILEIATEVSEWTQAKLFAECINKFHFDPAKTKTTIGEQAFEQIVSRFEQYLENTGGSDENNYGLIIHDNNETVAHKHTDLMRNFH